MISNHKIMRNYFYYLRKTIYTRNAICVMDFRSAIYAISNNLNIQENEL